jgi:hypothetical protein
MGILNKKTCMVCINRRRFNHTLNAVVPWGFQDEKRWLIGKVCCPRESFPSSMPKDVSVARKNDSIPELCVFLLEQTVAFGVDNDEA